MAAPKHEYGVQVCTASGINIFLGLWLLCSPWVFDYGARPAVVGNVSVGALIALIAGCRIATWRESSGLSGINLVLGLWTAGSPWICEYADNLGGTLNSLIVGLL